jgi:uncharacterized membrane protein
MAETWMTIWTALWFVGLSVFSVLSVLTIYFGGLDLVAMLASLRRRHLAASETECPPEGPT